MLRNVMILAAVGLLTAAVYGVETPADSTKFAVYGGTDGGAALHQAVAEAVAAQGPDFVIHTGDMESAAEAMDSRQPGFITPAKAITAICKIYPVRGTGPMDDALFKTLHDAPDGRFYYSFDSGPVHVVVLDAQATGEQRKAMLDWLEKDLSAAHAAWTVVACHEPFFTVDGQIGRWGQDDVLPILQKHGVDVVLSGHAHAYERFVPIGPAGSKSIIHVVTAGGGAPGPEPARSPMLAAGYGYNGPHFCLFEVKGNQLELTMRRPDGSVLDRLTLVKTDGAYQKDVMDTAVDPVKANVLAPLSADFNADFPTWPEAGKPTKFIIDGRRFPAGSQVTISAAAMGAGGRGGAPAGGYGFGGRGGAPAGGRGGATAAPAAGGAAPAVAAPAGAAAAGGRGGFGGGGRGGRGFGGPLPWIVAAQTLPAAEKMTIDATAPPGLNAGPDGFDPPLWLKVSVEVGGQTYTADQVQVPLTQAIAARRFPEPTPVPVPYSAKPITVDGDPADWEGIAPMPMPFKAGAPGSVRLCWREDGLYGIAVVKDDTLKGNVLYPWEADGVELFVERDAARALVKTKTAIEICLGAAPEKGPGPGYIVVPYGGAKGQAAQIKCAWRPTADGYVLEFCLPAPMMVPAQMQAGTKIGLNFLVDNDGKHVECFYSDNSVLNSNGWCVPITWGAIVLTK